MTDVTIYALVDPAGRLCYVGQSGNPVLRAQRHWGSRQPSAQAWREAWEAWLGEPGHSRPEMWRRRWTALDEVPTSMALTEESGWIVAVADVGEPLSNRRPGRQVPVTGTYHGKPCTYCGGTKRARSSRACVHRNRKDHLVARGALEHRRERARQRNRVENMTPEQRVHKNASQRVANMTPEQRARQNARARERQKASYAAGGPAYAAATRATGRRTVKRLGLNLDDYPNFKLLKDQVAP